jgi:hypothetical protein
MSNNDEVRQVLKMVADGKITVEEADELIAAIQESVNAEKEPEQNHSKDDYTEFFKRSFPDVDIPPIESTRLRSRKARWFRIIVTDVESNKVTTNVRLPMGFGNLGLNRFLKNLDVGLKGNDFDAIAQNVDFIDEPTIILDVTDDDEHVQIFIE